MDLVNGSGSISIADVASTKLTIASGATVIGSASQAITVNSEATLDIKGTVVPSTNSTVEMIKGTGTVNVLAGATITNVNFASGLTVNIDSSVMKEVTINGETNGETTYDQAQTVTVSGTWTLVAGANVIVKGKLVVPEGSALVIQEGAKLDLQNGAVMEIEGTLEISEKSSTESVYNAGMLTITKGTLGIEGSAIVNGTLTILENGKVKIEQDAVLTIDEDGIIAFTAGEVAVGAGAVLNLDGKASAALTIKNSGTVVIDSDVDSSAVTIDQMADGAVVDVVKFTIIGSDSDTTMLTIRDTNLVFAMNKSTPVNNTAEKNELIIAITKPTQTSGSDLTTVANFTQSVTGLKVVSSVTSEATTSSQTGTNYDEDNGVYNKKIYTKIMDISGNLDASVVLKSGVTDEAQTAKVGKVTATLTGLWNEASTPAKTRAYATVSGSLALTENSAFTVSASTKVVVTGAISAASSTQSIKNSGIVSVQKDGSITDLYNSIGGTVQAARYVTSSTATGSTVKTYHYVTIDAALKAVSSDSSVKEIEILGNQTMETDAELPAGVTMKIGTSAVLTIGASAGDDVELTVMNGATVNGSGSIYVNGTLYAENKNDVKISSKVTSDVYSEEIGADGKVVKNGWGEWTNLAAALAGGVDKTVTVSKETDYVKITKNLTIPAGTTLVVPEGKAPLQIADGVTLTIDGTLKTYEDVFAKTRFAANAMNVGTNLSSAVVVNGSLISADQMVYGTGADVTAKNLSASAPVAGAYYAIDEWYVITTVKTALEDSSIVSETIVVNGAVTGSDLTVTAGDSFSSLVIGNTTIRGIGTNATDIYTSLTVTSLTLGDGTSLEVFKSGSFTGTVQVGSNAVQASKIAGADDTTGFTVSSDDGDLLLSGNAYTAKSTSLTISAGIVVLDEDFSYTTVSGTSSVALKIASGATAEADSNVSIAKIDVAGTLSVPASKSVTVADATISGSVETAKVTDTSAAGVFKITGTAYVGMTSKTITGAAASITGPLTLTGKMLVYNGSNIDQDMSAYSSTSFYNNGSLWFIAYGTGSITVKTAPIENAVLEGWAKTEGATSADVAASEAIVIGTPTKLYSVVKTDIYNIVIKADNGIGDLYLNGNIMQKGYIQQDVATGTTYYYAYTATVSAGTYEVTCKLANGYSGTAVLKDSAGQTLSGNKFTASGTPASGDSMDLEYQLTGIEKSGYVPETEKKDDSGLTVTDYLLIVLVILVVVLAVIVALRLMRS